MTGDGWTITDAAGEFSKTGLPFEERNLRAIIRNLPGFQRIGERRPLSDDGTDRGGRGEAIYEIADLQQLHGFLASRGWLTPPPDSS